MKAEELMIGDWVIVHRIECVGDGGQFQEWKQIGYITRINEDTVYVMFDKQKEDWEEIDVKDIHPIPLTPEILEKNGFEVDEKNENMLKWRWSVIDDCISYDKSTGMVRIFYPSGLVFVKILEFVHELQHALRLCGITKNIIL